MKKTERYVAILRFLKEKGSKPISELCEEFKISKETMRFDINYLASKDKVYYRRNQTGIRYVVLIPDNCKAELYERVDVGAWIEEQKKKGVKLP